MVTSADREDHITVTTGDEPTLQEAVNATPEEREKWLHAIDEELSSLHSKNTWVVDDQPPAQPLPTHIVLKIKRKSDGSIERFKARIVAGGNHQKFGEDYSNTYAPVVSFSLVRVFLYIALCMKMCIAQLDVKTAFLNGDLEERVYG